MLLKGRLGINEAACQRTCVVFPKRLKGVYNSAISQHRFNAQH